MTNPTPGGVPDDKFQPPPEASLGGADAVEKTSYVTGSGTDPERMHRDAGHGRAEPAPPPEKGAGTGPNTTWAIIVFLAVAAVLVYLLGLGR
jgi:hypothetical protein